MPGNDFAAAKEEWAIRCEFALTGEDALDVVAPKFTLKPEMKYVITVGSVGQPRDGDCRSCYVILEDETVHFHRVEYPFHETARKIYEIPELDDFLGDRLGEGR